MASKLNWFRERRATKRRLKEIREDPKNTFLIHYSCESFYDTPLGRTARVTCIAVRNLHSAQTRSFSIHKVAEQKYMANADIPQHYDRLEQLMLKEFYEFVQSNSGRTFVHWNMRDHNYGFAALEHRLKVLGGKPVVISESQKFDLARAMVSVYGRSYMQHGSMGRFLGICALNQITDRDALAGAGEAQAFVNGDYLKLQLSTLRKIDMMANVFERAEDGTLTTEAKWKDNFSWHPQVLVELIREHWAWSLFVILTAVVGFAARFF